ncbi:MAG: TIGR02597 family protein [Chthoniobacterales bacterium]
MLHRTPSSRRISALSFSFACVLFASLSVAQTVVTDPVGFTTSSCLTNSDTVLGLPFTRPQSFVGAITSVAGSVITVTGSPGWVTNQFVYVQGSQPNRYYALIGPASTTNPKEGHIFTITGNSASTLTVDTTADTLTGIPANAQVVVIPYWTPATLFPASNANISFTPTTSPPTYKTLLRVPNYSAVGINLPYAAEYYFNSGAWQRISPSGVGDDDALLPDGYFVVRTSNGAPTLPLTNLGAVLLKKTSTALLTAASPGQDNPAALVRPFNVALNATGLSSAFGPSDQLLLFDNTQAAFDKAPSATYTYDTHWRLAGDATLADRGSDVIPQGNGFLVRKSGGLSVFWTNAYPVAAVSAVSRFVHAGIPTPFDVNLPLSGASGIECRTSATSNAYQIVFTFPLPVTYTSASITSGAGGVGTSRPSQRSATSSTVVTVNLVGVTNGQYITLTLAGVNDGTNTNDVAVRMGILTGDANGDGSVNSADVGLAKSKSGQSVDSTNFREDLNTDGNLNSADVGLVKSKSGTGLP